MGIRNSSETRVQPIFNELLDRDLTGRGWLRRFCEIANQKSDRQQNFELIGELLANETPRSRPARKGRVFERLIPPPGHFLYWLLQNPAAMHVADPVHFGSKSPEGQHWRRQLFSTKAELRRRAQFEGTSRLLQHGADNSRHQWWAFEGFTHADCCLMTDAWVILIEGKRTEAVSGSTGWFASRSQLWRNVESAQVLAGGRRCGVILGVENDDDGTHALEEARTSVTRSLPHLSEHDQDLLAQSLLGFVTWQDVVRQFDLPSRCMPTTTDDIVLDQIGGLTLAGIDGCKGGWVIASGSSDLKTIRFAVVENVGQIFAKSTLSHITIDIPIGLPSSGPRPCDLAARKTLGPGQRSRVFPAPSRAALAASNYSEACALNLKSTGKALSQQAFAITPKIRQVDEFMSAELQSRVRETHPEVTFCILNNGPLQHSKATHEGKAERMNILARFGISFDPNVERLRLGRNRVAEDDLLDAAAALITAHRIEAGMAVVLGGGETDERDLRLEIVA